MAERCPARNAHHIGGRPGKIIPAPGPLLIPLHLHPILRLEDPLTRRLPLRCHTRHTNDEGAGSGDPPGAAYFFGFGHRREGLLQTLGEGNGRTGNGVRELTLIDLVRFAIESSLFFSGYLCIRCGLLDTR